MTTRTTLLLHLYLVTQLPGITFAQFCTSLNNNTWAGFVEGIKDSSQNGLAVLCPFIITGDGCPSQEEYPLGLVVDDLQESFISCDRFQYGFNTDTECIIDCPGRHFTVAELSKLTLERLVLTGATDSSIKVEEGGSLTIKNSILKDNVANEENGGGIRASMFSTVIVEYSQFMRNEAVYGGAIYGLQESKFESIESIFDENKAMIAGGAYANDVYSNCRFEKSEFHGNEASAGGAIFVADYSIAKILGGIFDKNLAINGGSIFDGGAVDIYDSTFNENVAQNSGGAIYIDAGSSTSLFRNVFINNRAALFGPAVNNRFNIVVDAADNTGCGNVAERTNSQCNGAFVFVGRRQRRCEPFSKGCTSPTAEPTISPAPTAEASRSPISSPTKAPTPRPSVRPTSSPSVEESDQPTPMESSSQPTSPSMAPSLRGSFSPTQLLVSAAPSIAPSIAASGTPSVVMSETPSIAPSNQDSSIPTSDPSVLSSLEPSVAPSVRPTFADSSSPTRSPSIAPTGVPSAEPTVIDSSAPSMEPTYQPSLEATVSPSDVPTSNPTKKPSEFPTLSPTSLDTPRPTNRPLLKWSTRFPLDWCEGDCDRDEDCQDGLVCFQRGRFESVPGCAGGSQNESKTDYCIKDPSRITLPPTTTAPTKSPTMGPTLKPTRPPTFAPTRMASDVPTVAASSSPTSKPFAKLSFTPTSAPSLEASSRPSSTTTSPSLQPSRQETSSPTVAFTFRPTPTLTDDFKPPVRWSTRFPLGLCEGDCDADWNCEGDLICFQRNEFVSVPGCTGGAQNESRTDYCVKPEYANRR